ncbi:carbohydrate ABC transporter permease [Paenibacillus mucilaginosus]|uniref:YurN n=3 Tax=Paenibacillus mucilaginosus TaxID=61624 RepID=H6NNA2_9BACL|nr:sugar ABC transporter permease [Paenibacillus mucilaginosus]AEI44232.1 YurN [Paenibacillus mucilaginosus KNP414]AFC31778.1 YurN [Paenibacillus mucilaginosus 3016]AFH64133.1 ABC transporter permease [Paenibacillus mucilaginosus K02]MCG7216643.1 sugar ABC transporter permease [Paenibacillus mucilaginosus]WDM25638.1 sugar ABC transporter permease [Paenibacillus mucilaginosus]
MTHRRLTPYFYVAPSLLVMILFIYYPVVQNLQSSLFDWSPFSSDRRFIGLGNYTRLLQDSLFYSALKNNLLHVLVSVLLQVLGALVLAAVLEDRLLRAVAPLLRTVYFLPVLISVSIIGLLFGFIYHPEIGLLNGFLRSIGLEEWTTGWLGNSKTAMLAVISIGQWQGLGYTTMLYIVAIQKIPQELYEAGRIDGCGRIQSFFHITLPQVKEIMFVVTVYTLSQSILVFSDVFVLTKGGPGDASQVLSTYLYRKAFVDNEMGYASTVANMILIITFMLYLVQSKLFNTGRER